MLEQKDLDLLKQKGIAPATVEAQLARFATGFPYLRLKASAKVGEGIMQLSGSQQDLAVDRWNRFLADGGSVCKFVPASGAASRMFKALFAFVNGEDSIPAEGSDVANLIASIDKTPFYDELNRVVVDLHGKNIHTLLEEKRYKDIISAIILPEGLNYGNLPKAVLSFHRYPDGTVRTPLEEQLMEGAQTAAVDGKVNLHFTVSAAHQGLFADKLAVAVPKFENATGLKYNVSTSEQKPSTDTIAAALDNSPFRDDNGNLVFRPGGHGALIENLNDIDATVVFIKNIDNVVPDSQRAATVHSKKVLAGTLILAHDKVEEYLRALREGARDEQLLSAVVEFLKSTFSISSDKFDTLNADDLAEMLIGLLNRPLRVCGMVRNEGEPGGGPFIAYNPDGTASPQILESTQIDTSVDEYKNIMSQATHFNPVDLVCYIRNIDGDKFNLPEYVDPETGFISSKSLGGRELRALELPGLWNGAMSNWLTIFVEVPGASFNPVKTVNDLLRPAHQG
ncbi:MAG: DUF4301 family protein [Bacteroides sp.]|nr:DUF4301 family protein [Bacteroides sp.]MCM1456530.1 DUF4301 family protein [Lachnoclostridium sp.]